MYHVGKEAVPFFAIPLWPIKNEQGDTVALIHGPKQMADWVCYEMNKQFPQPLTQQDKV